MDDDATLPSTVAATSQAPAGRVVVDPRYEVGPVIGRGGMGEIRIARDTRIDREVAVKLMRGSPLDDESVSRFFREARVQGALEHPAMVPVHDLGLDAEGNPYFVMKKLAGTTLASVLDAPQDDPLALRFPRRTVLARLVDVTHAIVFAHSRGVIHRDLKPANVMLGDFGEAYVLDWGLARIIGDRESFRAVLPLSGDNAHTAVGAMLGTPGYMSPEQARGEDVDAATDVFALGSILYEILAGAAALPRGLAAIEATLTAHAHRPSAHRADVPPELDDLCAAATAQDRKQRPTARAFVQQLGAYLDGDRDQQRRKVLAEEHAARAEAAYMAADGRVEALREAGRALAMEPTNARAGALLGRLLLEAPAIPPPEAIANADRERERNRDGLARAGGIGFVGMACLAPILFLLDIKHVWPLIALTAALGTQGVMLIAMSRLQLPLSSRWIFAPIGLNVVIIGLFGLVFGPLLIAPMVLTGSIAGWLLVPTRAPVWSVIGMHAFAIVPLVVLEGFGVMPSTFQVHGGSLVLTPWAVGLTPATTALVMAIAIVGQQIYLAVLLVQGTRATARSQDLVHTQRWHLEQVMPRSRD